MGLLDDFEVLSYVLKIMVSRHLCVAGEMLTVKGGFGLGGATGAVHCWGGTAAGDGHP